MSHQRLGRPLEEKVNFCGEKAGFSFGFSNVHILKSLRQIQMFSDRVCQFFPKSHLEFFVFIEVSCFYISSCNWYWEPYSHKMLPVRMYMAMHPFDWKFCSVVWLCICCRQIWPLMFIHFIGLDADFCTDVQEFSPKHTKTWIYGGTFSTSLANIPTLCSHIYFLTLVWSCFQIHHELVHPNNCS